MPDAHNPRSKVYARDRWRSESRGVGEHIPGASTAALRPLWAAAAWLQRSEDTLRDWYKRGLLTKAACDVRSRQLLVDLVEVEHLHRERPPRAPRRRSTAA